ncbi:hypothetical protein JA1_004367 [Spathaspora sp. JA1]|nr:hypothetical protein JA1_004367 [Spathaspora sp. JA1]
MTASTQYNYNRRNSTTATSPYTIPTKHQQVHVQHMPSSYQTHHHSHSYHQQQYSHSQYNPQPNHQNISQVGQNHISPLSSSVPTLSREFVVRRISEGETGRLKEELRCEACGKGYKHISSLAKHLWEHTPEWNVTKKLLISKHQQVQLLEAASILMGMNEPGATPTTTSANNGRQYGLHQRNPSDDPRYSSPFSPPFPAHENSSNTTPTPPLNEPEPSPRFKNGYHTEEIYRGGAPNESSLKFDRSLSVSQYPPSSNNNHHKQPSSPHLNGGYLATTNNKEEDNDHHDRDQEHGLKSPSLSSSFANLQASPVRTKFAKIEHNEDDNEEYDNKKDESFEEGVLGQMED